MRSGAWLSTILYSVGGLVVGYLEAQIVGAIIGLAMGSAAAGLGIWIAFKTAEQGH